MYLELQMNKYLTAKQAEKLKLLGFDDPVIGHRYTSSYYAGNVRTCGEQQNWNRSTVFVSAPTVDEAIDWLRRKFNVHIYAAVEPFVDPVDKKSPTLYRYAVKYCNRRDGWNGRSYIGQTRLAKNVYSLKRQAITLAINWLNKRNKTLSK